MKKYLALVLCLLLVGLVFTPAMASAEQIRDCGDVQFPLVGSDCNFSFWDGNGTFTSFNPVSYHYVLSASGNAVQIIKGVVPNSTGMQVLYSAFSGSPIPTGQTCWNFQTGQTTENWEMTIEPTGQYTLVCNYKK